MKQEGKVTDEQLESAYQVIAGIVTVHGEKYLPIFERVYNEVKKRNVQKKLMALAAEVAK